MTLFKRPNWLIIFLLLLGIGCFDPTQLAISGVYAASKPKTIQESALQSYRLGLKKEKARDLDGAIDAFLQAVYFARNNYYPEAYYQLGLCYKAKNMDAKAIEAFNHHLQQVVGNSPDARIELGVVYMRNDRDEEASRQFTSALTEYHGPAPRAHNAYGKLLQKKGDLENAKQHFLYALGDERPWTYTQAWENLAEILVLQKQWSEAIKTYEAILDSRLKDVNAGKVYTSLGICQAAKGNHQGALISWRQAAEADPAMPEPHLFLGRMFDQEKHISSAINEYRAYVRLAPPSKGANVIKDRIAILEQQLTPAEPIAPVKPSPFMRQQAQDSSQAREDSSQVSRDSGF